MTAIEMIMQRQRERISEWEKYDGVTITRGSRGVMVSILNNLCVNDTGRRAFLSYICDETIGEKSSGDLTDAQLLALFHWMKFYKDEDENEWKASDEFISECATVMTKVRSLWHEYNTPIAKEAIRLGGKIKPSSRSKYIKPGSSRR